MLSASKSTFQEELTFTCDSRCVGARRCVGTVKLSSLSKPVLACLLPPVSVPAVILEAELTVIGA